MISDIELNELPRGVRERFRDLKDDAFSNHPKVIAARERLDEHQEQHADCVERVTALKQRVEQLLVRQRNARLELQAVADSRQKLIAEALIDGDDLSADRAAKERCIQLEHLIEAIDLGMPEIRRKLDRMLESTRTAAISLQADEDHLRGLLDELKLTEAQRLYNQ